MVYKHKTKNGKIRHYQSKRAYEDSLKGMFAKDYLKKNHSKKIAKAKTKSNRQMKHRGVGKVSSTKKKLCDTCRGEGLSLTEGKCKVCAKEFKTFKQPNIQDQARLDAIEKITDATTISYSDILEIENKYDIKFDDAPDIETWSDIHSNAMELLNSQGKFEIYRDKDTAIAYAVDTVRMMIEQSPEDFRESLLQNHVTMTDADIRMRANQEAETGYDWEGFTDEELKHRVGKGWDETKSREQLIADGRYNESQRIKKELEESPLAYYVTDTGFYTKAELMKQDWIKVNAHEAAEEAVQEDGVAHYVARADGEELVTTSGKHVYRLH